jgi:redox-sensitive bicupin YhaK (pirin superfamily)
MKKILYKAHSRGSANFGWLKAKYSFSFAHYYDPKKIHFGMLRVLNDDIIEAGKGFGEHPHDNMEIVTIPLKGALAHKDSQGHEEVIRANDVQIMSAGTGITHSEYNHSDQEIINLLQIWVFPKEKNIVPRYDQKTYDQKERKNNWQLLVSPEKNNGSLWINQNAYFSRATIAERSDISYSLNSKENGIYLFLVEGEIEIAGDNLYKRDAIGFTDTDQITINSIKGSDILIIEIPMI